MFIENKLLQPFLQLVTLLRTSAGGEYIAVLAAVGNSTTVLGYKDPKDCE